MSDFIKVGGVQKLQDGEFIVQVSFFTSLLFNKYMLSLGLSIYQLL